MLVAALAAPVWACPAADKPVAPAANASPAEDRALLEALLARRAEIARAGSETANRRAALAFLDRQIAALKSRLGT
jgi:hypothetical protein